MNNTPKRNVLVLTRYSLGGASSRLRFFQYFPYLEKNSIVLKSHPLFDDSYLNKYYGEGQRSLLSMINSYLRRLGVLFSMGRYQCIWIEGELLPWIPAFLERLISGLGVPYIVDYDDAIFHNYDKSSSGFVRAILGSKIDLVMRKAHTVVAGNNYIADRARLAGAKNVVIIPTVVDTARYNIKQNWDSKRCLNIGWIGTKSTKMYLEIVRLPIEELGKETEIQFTTVGIKGFKIENVKMHEVTWSESTEAESIGTFDVGLMPLPDTSWARGKCGYKLIQYMACGIPVLASPVGVNSQIVDHGGNGFLVQTSNGWAKFLKQLMNDVDMMRSMGLQGRRKVEEEYSLNVMEPKILNLFSQIK